MHQICSSEDSSNQDDIRESLTPTSVHNGEGKTRSENQRAKEKIRHDSYYFGLLKKRERNEDRMQFSRLLVCEKTF